MLATLLTPFCFWNMIYFFCDTDCNRLMVYVVRKKDNSLFSVGLTLLTATCCIMPTRKFSPRQRGIRMHDSGAAEPAINATAEKVRLCFRLSLKERRQKWVFFAPEDWLKLSEKSDLILLSHHFKLLCMKFPKIKRPRLCPEPKKHLRFESSSSMQIYLIDT